MAQQLVWQTPGSRLCEHGRFFNPAPWSEQHGGCYDCDMEAGLIAAGWTPGMRPDEVQQRPCGCRGHNMPPGWLCPIHDLKLAPQWRAVLTDVV